MLCRVYFGVLSCCLFTMLKRINWPMTLAAFLSQSDTTKSPSILHPSSNVMMKSRGDDGTHSSAVKVPEREPVTCGKILEQVSMQYCSCFSNTHSVIGCSHKLAVPRSVSKLKRIHDHTYAQQGLVLVAANLL